MKTKIVTLYEFDELPTKEAKDKAIRWWIDGNTYDGLSEWMEEYLGELLNKNKWTNKADDAKVMYSLSYSQGDGAMFTGTFEWDKYTIEARHSGHYYHYNSKSLSITLTEDGEEPDNYRGVEEEINEMYISIAEDLKKEGYSYIEHEDNEENIADTLRVNEYTFLENGKRED